MLVYDSGADINGNGFRFTGVILKIGSVVDTIEPCEGNTFKEFSFMLHRLTYSSHVFPPKYLIFRESPTTHPIVPLMADRFYYPLPCMCVIQNP